MKKRNRSRSIARAKKRTKNRFRLGSNFTVPGTYSGGVARPLGRSIRATHTYATRSIVLNPDSIQIPVSHVFSANGLFDPDITGIGQQPVGFDQMTPLFDHYTVIYAQISVDFIASDQSTGSGCLVGVRTQDNTTIGTDVMQLTTGDCATGIVSPAEDHINLTRQVSLSRFLGRPNIMSEDDLRGTSGSNPDEQAYFHVFAFPFPGGGDVTNVNTFIRIDYVAIWTEPRSLSAS